MNNRPLLLVLIIVAGVTVGAAIAYKKDSQVVAVTAATPVPQMPAKTVSGSSMPGSSAPVSQLIKPLEDRLAQSPNDPSGWTLLAKSYEHLGEPSKAIAAYQSAIRYGNDDPATSAALNSLLAGQTGAVPNNATTSQKPAELNAASMLRIGRSLESAPQRVISGEVSIAPEFAAKLTPGHVLFVYATDAGDAKKMPLAAVKKSLVELPAAYQLNESMSMMQGYSLAAAGKIRIKARVSATGNALSKPGDWYAESEIIDATHSDPVNLHIDRVIQ